jgi:hypothetical protein
MAEPSVDRGQIEQAVQQSNACLPDYAQVRRYLFAMQPFSPQLQKVTANGRPRDVIAVKLYAGIEALYREAIVRA